MSDTIRLCVQTHHPIDPGNYEGPIHCTACPEGTPCVTALYVRLEEVNDLRDQVQMYEEKAERDWRDFGEMQDARIAADDRVRELEAQIAACPEDSVSYRVRDRDSDYKAMCHADRDHAELLLKAWLSDGRDAVIESRIVYDAGWNLLASSTAEKLAAPRKRSASASDPMPLCDCELCARPLRDHDEEETR